MTKDSFIPGMQGWLNKHTHTHTHTHTYMNSNNICQSHHPQRIKRENHAIVSVDVETSFGKLTSHE